MASAHARAQHALRAVLVDAWIAPWIAPCMKPWAPSPARTECPSPPFTPGLPPARPLLQASREARAAPRPRRRGPRAAARACATAGSPSTSETERPSLALLWVLLLPAPWRCDCGLPAGKARARSLLPALAGAAHGLRNAIHCCTCERLAATESAPCASAPPLGLQAHAALRGAHLEREEAGLLPASRCLLAGVGAGVAQGCHARAGPRTAHCDVSK